MNKGRGELGWERDPIPSHRTGGRGIDPSGQVVEAMHTPLGFPLPFSFFLFFFFFFFSDIPLIPLLIPQNCRDERSRSETTGPCTWSQVSTPTRLGDPLWKSLGSAGPDLIQRRWVPYHP